MHGCCGLKAAQYQMDMAVTHVTHGQRILSDAGDKRGVLLANPL